LKHHGGIQDGFTIAAYAGYGWGVAGCCAEEVALRKEGSNENEHYYGEIMNEKAKFIEANV